VGSTCRVGHQGPESPATSMPEDVVGFGFGRLRVATAHSAGSLTIGVVPGGSMRTNKLEEVSPRSMALLVSFPSKTFGRRLSAPQIHSTFTISVETSKTGITSDNEKGLTTGPLTTSLVSASSAFWSAQSRMSHVGTMSAITRAIDTPTIVMYSRGTAAVIKAPINIATQAINMCDSGKFGGRRT